MPVLACKRQTAHGGQLGGSRKLERDLWTVAVVMH
uniref:Uncharacterized protein n=1 Tax=Arundo donax TaxID=35708 RepID=A0A0A9BIQ6_ARUDO